MCLGHCGSGLLFFFVEKGREYPLPIKIIFSGSARECGPKEAKKNSDIGTRTRVSCGLNGERSSSHSSGEHASKRA